MPDIWMDVDTALAEVPVNIFPLTDDTDGKSIEGTVAYNAAGMALRWHFVTTGGAYTVTSVTPTTGGDYDWTDQGDSGIYTIEIPASGGASINNDTEGFGWFTGVATGILPWRGPIIGFRAAGLNDLLIDNAYSATRGLAGTALPAAAADAAGGLPISDAGGLDLDTYIKRLEAAFTATIAGRIDAAISTRSSHSAADVKTAVEAAGSHLTLIKAKTDNLPADPADDSDIDAQLATIAGYLDTEIAAILAAVDTEVATLVSRIVGTLAAGTHNPQSGDAYARLGAPAGASVSADIAALLDPPFKKNTAVTGFPFFMADASDHVTGMTGLAITATRSLDGAAFGACANAASEIGGGWYKIDLAAGDLNGDVVALKFTAALADETGFVIKTVS